MGAIAGNPGHADVPALPDKRGSQSVRDGSRTFTALRPAQRVTVEELQALLRRREPDDPDIGPVSMDRSPETRLATRSAIAAGARGAIVVVLGAHGGAGASTTALAIAEALAARVPGTRLVDCADPPRSDSAAATTIELGIAPTGWRTGRRMLPRSELSIDRLARRDPRPPGGSPVLPRTEGVLVMDVGRTAWELLPTAEWEEFIPAGSTLVLVCRTAAPGIRSAERVLAEIDQTGSGRPVWVAMVGSGQRSRAVEAAMGSQLRAVRRDGRTVSVPFSRRLAVRGVTNEPLPKAVAAGANALAALLISDRSRAIRSGSTQGRPGC